MKFVAFVRDFAAPRSGAWTYHKNGTAQVLVPPRLIYGCFLLLIRVQTRLDPANFMKFKVRRSSCVDPSICIPGTGFISSFRRPSICPDVPLRAKSFPSPHSRYILHSGVVTIRSVCCLSMFVSIFCLFWYPSNACFRREHC